MAGALVNMHLVEEDFARAAEPAVSESAVPA
jgi:hypothetical protein